jgi:RHS repeat-associated protein
VTVSELIDTWTPEEREPFAELIAECIKREQVIHPYGGTGREWDSETGLYYYRARYYDPKIGRFISKDPIGFAGGGVNLYRYLRNSPIS